MPLTPADQVVLRFEGEGGLLGRLRLTLRGESLRATLIAGNAETESRLQGGLGELQRRLIESGFAQARVAVIGNRGGPAAEAPGSPERPQQERDPSDRQDGGGADAHARQRRQSRREEEGRRP